MLDGVLLFDYGSELVTCVCSKLGSAQFKKKTKQKNRKLMTKGDKYSRGLLTGCGRQAAMQLFRLKKLTHLRKFILQFIIF